MRFESKTLAEHPFDFDIQRPFPADQRQVFERAVGQIQIRFPSEVSKLEQELASSLKRAGYLWDDEHPAECGLWRPDFNMSVDFFHPSLRIAVEVEKTEVKRIVHDVLKLINGSLTFVPKVRYGVVIHPRVYKRTTGKESVFGTRVVSEVAFYFKGLLAHSKLNDILFIAYELDAEPSATQRPAESSVAADRSRE
jgi:hypothetical protein